MATILPTVNAAVYTSAVFSQLRQHLGKQGSYRIQYTLNNLNAKRTNENVGSFENSIIRVFV